MEYLGLLTLGTFLGAIAAIGVRYIDSVESWQKVLLAILPAVLSGVALAFVDRFKYSPALGAYPLGLVVAFLWTYGDVAARNFSGLPIDPKDPTSGGYRGQRLIGCLHLLASTLATLAALAMVSPPAIKQVLAEWNVSEIENVAYLKQQRALLLAAAKADGKATTSSPSSIGQDGVAASDSASSPPPASSAPSI